MFKLPIKYPFGNLQWLTGIPVKIYYCLIAIMAPIRAIIWILDGLVSLTFLSFLGIIYAWWTHRISDHQVAEFANDVGTRILSILHEAHIF